MPQSPNLLEACRQGHLSEPPTLKQLGWCLQASHHIVTLLRLSPSTTLVRPGTCMHAAHAGPCLYEALLGLGLKAPFEKAETPEGTA